MFYWFSCGHAAAEQVAAPVLSPPGGTSPYGVAVEMHCPTDGARIYYTTDGSTPTPGSPAYSGLPIPITNQTGVNDDPDPGDPATPPVTTFSRMLRARAFKDGWTESPVVDETYIVDRVESYFNLERSSGPGPDQDRGFPQRRRDLDDHLRRRPQFRELSLAGPGHPQPPGPNPHQ